MTDFDVTDPWGSVSPWDQAGQNQTSNQTTQEAPVTNQPVAVAVAENVTLSFKGGPGYDASLLVLRAASVTEMDELLTKESASLSSLMQKAAKIQSYSTSLNAGGAPTQSAPSAPAAQPSFNPSSGQVQYNQPAPAQSGPPRPANVPDGWTYKEGTNKNGKPYKAWFPPRGVEATPIWV